MKKFLNISFRNINPDTVWHSGTEDEALSRFSLLCTFQPENHHDWFCLFRQEYVRIYLLIAKFSKTIFKVNCFLKMIFIKGQTRIYFNITVIFNNLVFLNRIFTSSLRWPVPQITVHVWRRAINAPGALNLYAGSSEVF